MGMGQVSRIPLAWPSQTVTAAAGTLMAGTLQNLSFLGSIPGGILHGAEKIGFFLDVSGLSASNTLDVFLDGSVDAINFTTGGQLAKFSVTANGSYWFNYNGSPVSAIKATYTQSGTSPSATVQMGVEASTQ